MTKLLLSAVMLLIAMLLSLDIHAASAASEPVPLCEPIAMAGGIMIYRCLPDEGYSFLINSMGFMVLEN